jgi:hypothetical protein
MPGMRSYLLSLPNKLQVVMVIGATVMAAFAVALAVRTLFDVKLLSADTGLASTVYGVFGTIYAVLLAFVVSGSWQNFSLAVRSVQSEASALLDLVHIVDTFSSKPHHPIRRAAISYATQVIEAEWRLLPDVAIGNTFPQNLKPAAITEIIHVVGVLEPATPREAAAYQQALAMLNIWLDARRDRHQSAGGGNVTALWPLLLFGAIVLFAFHGLFVAQSFAIWVALLLGVSLVVGLAFYLIFSLDSPFTGKLTPRITPYQRLINWCQRDLPPDSGPSEAQ